MSEGRSYRWLDPLLDLLFERFDRDQSLAMLQDDILRDAAMASVAPSLAATGMPETMFDTHEGRSLFLAVLTLRVKFPPEEAHAKVARNIAMREGRI